MKLFKHSLLAVALFALVGFTQAVSAQSLGELMIEFETSVKYESQTDSWRSERSSWLSSARSSDIGTLKNALLKLEQSINYSAQNDSWSSQRSTWISNVRSATTKQRLAALLIELETSVKYDAQNDSWSDERDSWLSRCRAVR
jgi:predicted GNAT superfamily acetyltransferase